MSYFRYDLLYTFYNELIFSLIYMYIYIGKTRKHWNIHMYQYIHACPLEHTQIKIKANNQTIHRIDEYRVMVIISVFITIYMCTCIHTYIYAVHLYV